GKKYSPWWSRTRSTDYPHEQRRVMDEGKIGRISTGNSDLGVRPAIHVDLKQLSILSGSGTIASPYQLVSASHIPSVNLGNAELPSAVIPAVSVQETAAPVQAAATQAPAADDIPVVILSTGAPETADASAEQKPTEAPTAEPTAEPVAQPAAPKGFTAASNPETIHEKFPELTAQGFLPDGESEFVYQDEAEGLWLYASQTLRIEINRRTGTNSKKQPLRWYEAQIFTKDESELFDFYPYDEAHYTSYGDRYKALADKIAVQHHLVFGINSDYFIYRIERDREESYDYPIGVVIRDGNVMYDRPKKATSTVYPPLDVMALYPDGTVSLHKNATVTGKELIAAGATDTFSFGPILVENGEVSPRSKEFGNTPNPRTAFGVVEPGYYIAVMVESRIAESKGESCIWMGEKMAELGCTSAINLDGGATSTMIFMGKQINKSGNYGDITNRTQNELFGIGHSDAVN
ncbi:MAG: phosphodiester glycosidase family protein, partial [Clostridia bacterium]|nr:phosphodiester glycosidase family protein [Clostridia bacterium]